MKWVGVVLEIFFCPRRLSLRSAEVLLILVLVTGESVLDADLEVDRCVMSYF